jgi:cytochrome c biogenesis protein CcmG/thiol:disulfide interchange protein DsbE
MKPYLRFIAPLVLFAIIVGFLAKGLTMDPRALPSVLIDKPAPEFSLEELQKPGEFFTKDDLLGKVTLLNVWATWCVSCRAEHPNLVALSRSKEVEINGLIWKDDPVAARTYLKQLGDPYTSNGLDFDGRSAIDLGVYGAPETFIIDKKGVIRHKIAGPLSPDIIDNEILPLVKKLREES